MTTSLATVAGYRYVSLTTFRRSGDPVSTPVWIARSGDELCFISELDTGKVKRLRRNSAVELRPCSMRGEVEPDAPTYAGTATLHDDDASIARVRSAIGAKYPEGRIANVVQGALRAVGLMRGGRVAVVITLAD